MEKTGGKTLVDGQRNCTDYGGVDSSRFDAFMPLVGKYVALASFACAVCIGLDLCRSFRWKKPWIAVKFFPLNAATLTLLAVAVKIPSDISEVMPGLFDQLAKRSGVVLVCISMNHMMPSLGVMNDLTVLSNMIALAILVVTLFVNILFQLDSRLITRFRIITTVESVLMLLIFCIFASHAFTVGTVKKLLAEQYDSKHQKIRSEIEAGGYLTNKGFPVERLKDYVRRYGLLALSSSPDYALRSSGMAVVSACVCYFLVIGEFLTNITTLILKQWREKTKGCYARSSYKRSSGYVFVIQAVAIILGAAASYKRILYCNPTTGFTEMKSLLRIEGYKIQKLQDWINAPLPFDVTNRRIRILSYKIRNLILLGCILLQWLIVLSVKVLLSVLYFPFYLLYSIDQCIDYEDTSTATTDVDLEALEDYVLDVEGIPQIKNKTIAKWVDHTKKWIENARSPVTLMRFLQEFSGPSRGFDWLGHVYSEEVLKSATKKLPNCWSLTLVTLAIVIRAAFRNTNRDESISTITEATKESLRYAIFVDKNYPVEGSSKMINAAKKVWDRADLFNSWMEEDLDKLTDKGDALAVIKQLQDIAGRYVRRKDDELLSTAADCLYNITSTISARHGSETAFHSNINNSLFPELRVALADTMGACLASLPHAILSNCCSGTFGAREEKVRKATIILGETAAILEWLETEGRLDQYPVATGIQYLDNWRERSLPIQTPSL